MSSGNSSSWHSQLCRPDQPLIDVYIDTEYFEQTCHDQEPTTRAAIRATMNLYVIEEALHIT